MILDDIEALRRRQDYQLDRVLDGEAAEKQRFEAEIMAIPGNRELQNIFPDFGCCFRAYSTLAGGDDIVLAESLRSILERKV